MNRELIDEIEPQNDYQEILLEDIKDDLEELLAREPVKGDKGDKGERGESVDEKKVISEILKKIPKPKDGISGKDADEEKIIEKVLSKIPKPKDGKDGEDGKDADEEKIVKEVLKKIPKPNFVEKNPIFGRGGGSSVFVKENGVTKDRAGNLNFIADSGVSINVIPRGDDTIDIHIENTHGDPKVFDLTGSCDGVTKTFTIPSNKRIIGVLGTQFPVVYRPEIDYTGSGTTTLTLTSEVGAPESGQTLIVQYAE